MACSVLSDSCARTLLGLVFRQHQDSHQSSKKPQTPPRSQTTKPSMEPLSCRERTSSICSSSSRCWLYGLGCIGYWRRLKCPRWHARVHDCGRKGSRDALRTRPRLQPVSFLRIIRMFRVLRVLRLMRTCGRALGKALSLMSNLFLLK